MILISHKMAFPMAIISFMESATNEEIEKDIDEWTKVARIITAKVEHVKMTNEECIEKKRAKHKQENKAIGATALKKLFDEFITPRFPNEKFDDNNISEAPDTRYMSAMTYNSHSDNKIEIIYWYRVPQQYPGVIKVIVNDVVIANKETNKYELVINDDDDD